jgi:hypothetical protein
MTRVPHVIRGLALAIALASAVPAPAQTLYVAETTDRYFQVEFDVTRNRKGPVVEGYVYNRGRQGAQRVRLEIERVDAAGRVIGSSGLWVNGDVPMESRAFFSASVPEAASYRVHVTSYDWTCSGGGSGM